VAKDVTHGFYLEGYDLDAKVRPENPTFWLRHPSQGEEYEEVEEIIFTADRTGKFRYRCSITCGSMHPFMQGELIVRPNYLYSTSIGLLLGLGVAMFIVSRHRTIGGKS
jgi:heme/copper-type cytochrome/quinol oxidase subunit 2